VEIKRVIVPHYICHSIRVITLHLPTHMHIRKQQRGAIKLTMSF